jgi:cytosine/adenosine deaminase-related metal-dependent hydrolase
MTAGQPAAANGQAPQQPAAAPQAPFPHPGQQTQPQGTQAFIANAPSQQAPQGSFGIAPGTPVAADPAVSTILDNFFRKP